MSRHILIALCILLLIGCGEGESTPAPVVIEGTPIYRSLTLEEAETVLGYPVWVPAALPEGWRFNGAQVDLDRCLVTQRYVTFPATTSIQIRQSCRRAALVLSGGERVRVGERPGRYTPGQHERFGRNLTLQWREDGYTFSVTYTGEGSYAEIEKLVQFAESLERRSP